MKKSPNLKSFSFLWFAFQYKVRGGGFRVCTNPRAHNNQVGTRWGQNLHRTGKIVRIPNVKWSLVKLEHRRDIILSLHQECKELSLQVPQHSPKHRVRFSSPCKRVYQVSALKTLLFGSKETKYLHIAFLGNRESQC